MTQRSNESQLGERMERTGERATRTLEDATSAVGRSLEGGARYLQETDSERIRSDVSGVMRNHPVMSMAVGIGLGFLIGRFLSRR